MNVFVLHRDPVKAARMHCDRHVVKMVSEYVQLLSYPVRHEYGRPVIVNGKPFLLMKGETYTLVNGKPVLDKATRRGFAVTHAHHPLNKWVAASQANWDWLYALADALGDEYTYRYGKVHESHLVLKRLHRPHLPEIGMTPFVLAMPDQYKDDNVVEAYRNLYLGAKYKFATWTRRRPPSWWTKYCV